MDNNKIVEDGNQGRYDEGPSTRMKELINDLRTADIREDKGTKQSKNS